MVISEEDFKQAMKPLKPTNGPCKECGAPWYKIMISPDLFGKGTVYACVSCGHNCDEKCGHRAGEVGEH